MSQSRNLAFRLHCDANQMASHDTKSQGHLRSMTGTRCQEVGSCRQAETASVLTCTSASVTGMTKTSLRSAPRNRTTCVAACVRSVFGLYLLVPFRNFPLNLYNDDDYALLAMV